MDLRKNIQLDIAKKDGEYKQWYREIGGLLREQCYYKEDKLEGEYKKWWDTGELRDESYYKDGKKEGKEKFWFDGKCYNFYKEGEL